MRSRFLLPPVAIGALLCFLVIGELAAGTDIHFVAMMSVAVLAACLTYNLLGGLGTISGIGFSGFAISSLILGQVGKAVLLQRADENLHVPQLTITVYAVYYVSLLAGVFVFARLRVPLPKPLEPTGSMESRRLYVISLILGATANIGWLIMFYGQDAATNSLTHAIARALGYLLPLSLVLAVDDRIRSTHGRHSFGWMAFWPALVIEFMGFVGASRTGFVQPLALIALTCFLRGYKFRRRHYVAVALLVASFLLFVSPYYIWARRWRGSQNARELARNMIAEVQTAPSQWSAITYDVGSRVIEYRGAGNYFQTPRAVTLNRFALIGPDSTLISACSTGFHYGFTALRLDFLSQIPRVLYPNKPTYGSSTYLGQLDGQESDIIETTSFSAITPVADSFGSFGWLGVVLFPFLVMPAIFVVYESMFDASRPWGTVATVLLGFGIAAGSMGGNIAETLIKNPIYILVLSAGAAWVIRMIPATGDRGFAVQKLGLDQS